MEQPCDVRSTAVCLVVPWQAPQGLGSGHHLSAVPAPLLVQLCSFLVVRAPWARMPGLEGPGAQRRAALESRAEGPWALHAHHDEGGQDPWDPWSCLSSLLSGHRTGSTKSSPGHRVTGMHQSQQQVGSQKSLVCRGLPGCPLCGCESRASEGLSAFPLWVPGTVSFVR